MTTRRGAYAMVYVTAPDRKTARAIAQQVLERRLAACANLLPSESLYWWKDRIEEARESVVIFKTRRTLVTRLFAAVRDFHPYDVPCAVSYAMQAGLGPYLEWIGDSTRSRAVDRD